MLFHSDHLELLFILKAIGVEARNLFSMTSACIHIGLVANWAKLFVPYHVICKASHSCAARVHTELFDLCAILEKGFCPTLWNLQVVFVILAINTLYLIHCRTHWVLFCNSLLGIKSFFFPCSI